MAEDLQLDEIFASMENVSEKKRYGNPFKFLDPYEPRDREIFFGRDTEIEELFRLYHRSNVLLVYGGSGTGKTSIVGCGLATRIPSSDAHFIKIRCGSQPAKNFIRELQKLSTVAETSAPRMISIIFRELHKPLVLVLDQFEENFLLATKEGREELYANLKEVIDSALPVKVIILIREEYLANLSEMEMVMPHLFSNRLRIEPMRRQNAQEAIEKPCAIAGITLEKDVAVTVLEGLMTSSRIELSYLQVYMDRLCRVALEGNADNPFIGMEDVRNTGVIGDVLGAFLEEQMELSGAPEKYRDLLKGMITPQGTKRQSTIAEMAHYLKDEQSKDIAEMVNHLVNSRILRELDDGCGYELRHDALAARIADWLTLQEKEYIEVEASMRQRLLDYRNREILLEKYFLNAIVPYEAMLSLNPEFRDLIGKSRDALTYIKKRKFRILTGVAVTAFAVVTGLALWAVYSRSVANHTLAGMFSNKGNRVTAEMRWGDAVLYYKKSLELADTAAARMGAVEAMNYCFREIGELFGHSKWVRSASFSRDGKFIVSASDDKTIKIWDSLSGELLTTLYGHTGPVNSAAFSPDGKLITSASDDKTIKMWDVSSKALVKNLMGHSNKVRSTTFSSDGKLIASASDDKTIKIWDASSGVCIKTLFGHSSHVVSVVFSPDCKFIASASLDNTLKIWDVRSGTLIKSLFGGPSWVISSAFSSDGKLIATANADNTIKIWDTPSGILIKTLSGHSSWVISVVFSPDNKFIVSSSDDRTIKIWDTSSGTLIKTLTGHSGSISNAVISPDGNLIASSSSDKTIKLWIVSSGSLIKTLSGHSDKSRSTAFSPDGKYIASASDDKTIKIWDAASGRHVKTLFGHSDIVRSASFSNDGKLIVSASDDKTIKIWDAVPGVLLKTLAGHSDKVRSASFSNDDKLIASTSFDKTIKIWDVSSGIIIKTLAGHTSHVHCASFSPDGKLIASVSGMLFGSEDDTIKIWDVSSGALIKTLSGHMGTVSSIVFSPDGRLIASSSWDKTIKLWDSGSGVLSKTLVGHENSVYSSAFSPDGKQIVSASFDDTIKIWDVSSGSLMKTLYGHSAPVLSAVFSPDGTLIASASYDNTIKIWPTGFNDPISVILSRLKEFAEIAISYDLDVNEAIVPADSTWYLNRYNKAVEKNISIFPDGGHKYTGLFQRSYIGKAFEEVYTLISEEKYRQALSKLNNIKITNEHIDKRDEILGHIYYATGYINKGDTVFDKLIARKKTVEEKNIMIELRNEYKLKFIKK